MKKKFKLGVIGAGFMATSIIKGAINSKIVKSKDIIVSDANETALDRIKTLKVSTTLDNLYLCNNAEFVLFAVKPQNLNDVLSVIKTTTCDKFISIMAGVKKAKIKAIMPNSKVARCMPNTPCSIGKGAIGLDDSDYTEDKDKKFINGLLGSLAVVMPVLEKDLNAVTGISGSSPAYFYLFLKGIIEAGVKNGLSEEVAKKLAVNTMIGSGEMVLSNPEKSLDDLITAVCSKGGTTIEAVNVYNDNDISKITEKAVDACVKRSKELENL